MPSPLVSALMTAYNREKYIAEAIESVLASTFQDFELIVVDDCSKDRTLEIARQYTADPRVRVHINEKNLGDYPNRNRAAELARGKYLKYVDSDDIIYRHGLAVMAESMEQFPEAGLGLCLPPVEAGPFPLQLSPEDAYREYFWGTLPFSNAPLSAIIRTDAFRSVGGFSGKRQIGDMELWLRLAARFPIVKLARDLTWWRTHGQQEFAYDSEAYKVMARFGIALSALDSPDCPLLAKDRQRAIRRVKRNCGRAILRIATVGMQPRLAWSLYRASRLSVVDLVNGVVANKQAG
jgi:glycosyltransferase involved in cell wall biosynthesis